MIGAIRPYSFSVQSLCNPFVFVQIWRQSALLRGRRLAASCPVSCGPYVPPCAGDATPAANALNGGLVAPADYFELRAVNAAKQAAAMHAMISAPRRNPGGSGRFDGLSNCRRGPRRMMGNTKTAR
ncbi:MAG: hypothetical protein IPK83_14455 [Planctomycetes bacterium]|nr:hypothetical protein [Planctomycetota bacterium]